MPSEQPDAHAQQPAAVDTPSHAPKGDLDAHVFGPLISAADLEEHRRLYVDVFGMTERGRISLGAEDSQSLFGSAAGVVDLLVLQTPGVGSGAVVCRFDPVSDETVRDYESRVDRDALKVIDFYAPDYPGAIAHSRQLGYRVVESEASYELEDGAFHEAHLWGPDNVVTAFLGGPPRFFDDFAQVTDRRVSEVQSISAPVSDAGPVLDFYASVFGWGVVYEYAIDDPSFSELVGVEEPLKVKSRNVGSTTREPYFGLIDYGLPANVGGSLRGRSVVPRRGLLGAVVTVDDLEEVCSRAGTAPAGRVVTIDVAPFGATKAVVLGAPHEVPHLVIEVPRSVAW